ncbi:MAG: MvaI/BcnI family restriction endonuclease, partial [Oscillospiraceae bacterium]|nr:MvaI/BcnI family restriction endonuclease [Oscillospiraceae bacterium]
MWTKAAVIERLIEIEKRGYIEIPQGKYRKDDGVIGQILEKLFDVEENNISLADLGKFELKGMRKKKGGNTLTLFHQTPSKGMTPIQIFDRFGYIKKSSRSDIMKKKLFTTIRGDKYNNRGFILSARSETEINLYYHDEYLSTWDLSEGKHKIDNVILAFAKTRGKFNTREESFHFAEAYLLSEPKNLSQAITAGAVVMDLCIDQPADRSKSPHDRGPHIRIPVRKLNMLFGKVEKLI